MRMHGRGYALRLRLALWRSLSAEGGGVCPALSLLHRVLPKGRRAIGGSRTVWVYGGKRFGKISSA